MMKQMEKDWKMNLTVAHKKMMNTLIIIMILILALLTEMVSKWTVCGFPDKIENYSAKS